MNLRIINKTNTDLELRIQGETHSLLNLLKNELLKNEHVDVATYDIKHVTMGDPVLFVRTVENHDPIEAVIQATERIHLLCEDFKKAFTSSTQ
jgi:DNA-directed RNA polymerase subunit L